MADSAQKRPKKTEPTPNGRKYGPTKQSIIESTVVGKPSNNPKELTVVQIRAARMMAAGRPIPEIARKLADHVCPTVEDRAEQLKKARTRIRGWVRTQAFRDAIYEEAMIRVDARTGEIVDGIVAKAVSGRVDAARLALEVTGRHSPHTEIQPAQVNVIFDGVPRPQAPKMIEDSEVIDVDAEVDPDDDSS